MKISTPVLAAGTLCAVLVAAAVPARADIDNEWLRSSFSKSSRGSVSERGPWSASTGSGQTGVASYYWQPQKVAAGGTFNPNALTAAHKSLPFGTRVRVTHMGSGRSVDVVINDRGPFVKGRVIDLSRRAAQQIGMTGAGLAQVRIERI